MSSFYPEIPTSNYCYTKFPRLPDGRHCSPCPVCQAHEISWRDLTSKGRSSEGCNHEYPHIEFACGGIYREVAPGIWGGKCWARKEQQLLQFSEVSQEQAASF